MASILSTPWTDTHHSQWLRQVEAARLGPLSWGPAPQDAGWAEAPRGAV